MEMFIPIPKDVLEKWMRLRVHGDGAQIIKIDPTLGKNDITRAFKRKKCPQKVFLAMNEFYDKKEKLLNGLQNNFSPATEYRVRAINYSLTLERQSRDAPERGIKFSLMKPVQKLLARTLLTSTKKHKSNGSTIFSLQKRI